MTDPKTRSRNQPKEEDRPKSDQPTVDKPKGHISSTDEGEERATGRADRDFDANVNQRPPR